MLAGIAAHVIDVLLAVLAAGAALLPPRHWPSFDRLPIRMMAGPSALATAVFGLVIGARGFVAYETAAADAATVAALETAARQLRGVAPAGPPITTLTPQLLSIASVIGFVLFTPLGLAATYLVVSGVFRVAAIVVDDAAGDPLLTGLDALVASLRRRSRSAVTRWIRTREEGPDRGDRLFTGEGAGLPGIDCVVVASRRKPDWTAGTTVMTSDGWYRLGEPFDARLSFGLRTVYPLTKLETSEVLRKAVRYELPPLQRGPGRLKQGHDLASRPVGGQNGCPSESKQERG